MQENHRNGEEYSHLFYFSFSTIQAKAESDPLLQIPESYSGAYDLNDADNTAMPIAWPQPDQASAVRPSVSHEIAIPLSLFRAGENSCLRLISQYLFSHLHLRYCEIARLLNRDDRTIWGACHHGSIPDDFNSALEQTKFSHLSIPAESLQDRNLSILESVVSYMREQLGFSYHDISFVLNKHYPTVYTVYRRSLKKRKIDYAL